MTSLPLRALPLLLLRRGLAAGALAAERAAALDRVEGRSVGLALEREPERVEQCLALCIGDTRGDDGDVHAAWRVDLVVGELREHDLLVETERVVATTVPARRRQ